MKDSAHWSVDKANGHDVTGFVSFESKSASDSNDEEVITRIVEWVATVNFHADVDRLLRLLGYDFRQERTQAWLDTRRTSRRRR